MQQLEHVPQAQACVQMQVKLWRWVLLPPLLPAQCLLLALPRNQQVLAIQMQVAGVEQNHNCCHLKLACLKQHLLTKHEAQPAFWQHWRRLRRQAPLLPGKLTLCRDVPAAPLSAPARRLRPRSHLHPTNFAGNLAAAPQPGLVILRTRPHLLHLQQMALRWRPLTQSDAPPYQEPRSVQQAVQAFAHGMQIRKHLLVEHCCL